jgi:hypothetical protein
VSYGSRQRARCLRSSFGAYTYAFAPFVFDTNLLYTAVTEGDQNTDLGDIADYNFSLAYRLGARRGQHHHDRSPSRLAWDAVLELNGEWREKLEVSGDVLSK